MKTDRLNLLLIGVFVVWGILLLRTFQIQVIEGSVYGNKADDQSQRRVLWKPERGSIVDRDGNFLATNQPFWNKTEMATRRLYPEGTLACQLLGYTGRDGQGLQSLEYRFDEKLRGIDGWSYQTRDATGHAIPGMERSGRAPTPGLQMVLTIQRDYQEIMENALAKKITELNADRGSALLMDPTTGEILAMASWPGFDPNKPINVKGSFIRNDLISLVFEPGSTFKAITASAALEEHSIDPKELINGEGGKMALPNGEFIRDSEDHGIMDMTGAMAMSSNIAFAKISKTVGKDKFYRYARKFGFGNPTMVEIPGEESGFLKPVDKWSDRTLITMAFGHEISSTPLQIAMAYATIANGGELVEPRIVKEWRNPNTGEVVQKIERKVIRRVISQETASQVRTMLRAVVQNGTAQNIKSNFLDFAGKTGTAEKYDVVKKKYDNESNLSSFVGMVPASNPKFICMVVVDQPRTIHFGGSTAAPIFKEIMERVYLHPRVSPQQFKLTQVQGFSACEAGQYIGLSQSSAVALSKQNDCPVAFLGDGPQVVAQRLGGSDNHKSSLVLTLGQMGSRQMPNLQGLSLRDALDALGSARAGVQVAGKGWVTEQNPLPNTPLVRGQALHLVLKEKS